MALAGIRHQAIGALIAPLLLSQIGCAPREGYGVADGGVP